MDKLYSGSILVFCGLLLRTGLLLIFEMIAARHLGPASYGLFSLAFTVIIFTATLPTLGLQSSLRRFISYHLAKGENDEVRGLVTFGLIWPAILGILFSGLLFVGSGTLSSYLFGKPDLGPLLRAMALVVPLWSARRVATVIFSGYKKTTYKIALEDFLEPSLRVVTAAVIALAGWEALQLGYGTLLAYLVVGATAWSLVLRRMRQVTGSGRGMRLPWQPLLAFSTPLIVSELVDIVLVWLNILLLGILSTDSEVGLFRSASQPPMLASATLTSFAFLYLPTATQFFARQNHAGWKRANNAVAQWTLSLAFPVGTICMLFPEQVIGVLFGSEYGGGAAAMRLLGASALLHAGCGVTGLNLMVAGYTKLQMLGALISLAANIGASLIWIPPYGAAGAAAAVLVAVALRNVYNLVLMGVLLRLCPFTWKYFAILGTHLASVGLLAGGAHVIQLPDVAAMLSVGFLELPLAVSLALLVGVLRKTDITSIVRLRGGTGEQDDG